MLLFFQDSLQLRFSLVGGLFEGVHRGGSGGSGGSVQEWATLLTQLIARGVVDLTKNSDLFLTVLDMLAVLVHSTLISDKESSSSSSSSGSASGSSSAGQGQVRFNLV